MTRRPRPSPVVIGRLVGIVILCIMSSVNADYFTGYLRDNCLCTSRSPQCLAYFTLYPVGGASAGFILLSRNSRTDQLGTGAWYRCTYTIVAPPTMTVSMRINSINIPLTSSSRVGIGGAIGEGGGGGCRMAALQIYDGNSTNDVSKQLIGMCGSALPTETVFSSTSSELTLFYYQSAEIETEPKSFNLTFTYSAFRKSGCSLKEFRCRTNSHCISGSLLCDGVENCPDGSDESSDYDTCGRFLPSSNPFVGTTVGVSLFLFFGLLLCVAAAKVKKQRRFGNSSTVTRHGATPSDSATATCLPHNNPSPSDNNLLLSANRPQVVNTISDNDITTSDDSRVNPYTGQGHTFQPLILVAGSRHVTVVAVAPPSCPDQAVRCTPPPAYESLFPEVANSIEENT